MPGTCCRTWAPSAPSTVPPPAAATIQRSPPAANLTFMPGLGGTDFPADVLAFPASRRLHITGRVQRPARGSSTHACPCAHHRRTGIRRADPCALRTGLQRGHARRVGPVAPLERQSLLGTSRPPGYRMSSREHTGMVDLGADGDHRTYRIIGKESAICNCSYQLQFIRWSRSVTGSSTTDSKLPDNPVMPRSIPLFSPWLRNQVRCHARRRATRSSPMG